jgi:cyclopropane-fatty-acyl-phospholipid synthase
MAEHFPNARITGVSNSRPQREYIEGQCRERGLNNVRIITQDVNHLALDTRFDRVVSIEMFEHLRNYQLLLQRLAGWLAPGGRLFVHVFAHRAYAYPYEPAGEADWMARTFFTGGLMPAHDLLAHFQDDLRLEDQWWLNGRHYQRTSNAWLRHLDARREQVLPLFRDTYGADAAHRWLVRWRLFFLACAELFGFRRGREWGVTHLRFAPRAHA